MPTSIPPIPDPADQSQITPTQFEHILDLPAVVELFVLDPDGEEPKRFTNTIARSGDPTVFGGVTYASLLCKIDNAGYTEENGLERTRLTVANVGTFGLFAVQDLYFKGYILEYIQTYVTQTGQSGMGLYLLKRRFVLSQLLSASHAHVIYELQPIASFGVTLLPRRQMLRDNTSVLRFAGLGLNKTS